MGAGVRESLWLFPIIETAHLLGMAVLFASIAAFDLKLLGWAWRGDRVSVVGSRLLPWAWAGLAIQIVTGTMLFASEATRMYRNPAFRLKLLLIAVAGVQTMLFQVVSRREPSRWEEFPPVFAELAGLVSILLWIGVIAAGRFIGFV